MKKCLVLVVVCCLLSSCGWFKKEEENHTLYTVEGTMYDRDGVTPLVGKNLELVVMGFGLTRKNTEDLAHCTTDAKGNYHF